ncbi:hypothetical protein LTR37_014346 [Vermiconidia calcicola]|uniref:Uncharacterized protein n=1 Tax=Vermiconidia calcicola TaxID=1690605 RepID=A0ACC3MU63_9PEZI|nr:hypothetical protein LTR37_014346 [Vermiconidia calcicola]
MHITLVLCTLGAATALAIPTGARGSFGARGIEEREARQNDPGKYFLTPPEKREARQNDPGKYFLISPEKREARQNDPGKYFLIPPEKREARQPDSDKYLLPPYEGKAWVYKDGQSDNTATGRRNADAVGTSNDLLVLLDSYAIKDR